jgi:hypothetical protein
VVNPCLYDKLTMVGLVMVYTHLYEDSWSSYGICKTRILNQLTFHDVNVQIECTQDCMFAPD